VLDRFIQQAVMQVLQADWDRTFSEASFGFRPGRRGSGSLRCCNLIRVAILLMLGNVRLDRIGNKFNVGGFG